ncbi:hypothetical protein Nepgr_029763 [Nepenthes gracilis]|uniref:Protein XRI1 n=1 Tax=Nepenthes gracilis TaxID=150966 RepID=A0AAD3TD74_NEPGR|nr:hypothetical protein Nepgr_029763 [Nepenthes gracilis]
MTMDCSNRKDSWDWPGKEYYIERNSNLDITQCMWDGITQNEEGLSCMFEETTPVKACGHFNGDDNMNKATEEGNEIASKGKRRRMLQFNNEGMDPHFPSEYLSSSFLKSEERIDCVEDVSPEVSKWGTRFQGYMCSPSIDGLDQSESWLTDILNDDEMHVSCDLYPSGTSDALIDVTEVCNIQTDIGANMVDQKKMQTFQSVVFRGRKSYMRTPTKLASSIAYPFAFIKPCGAYGDLTLKDINNRIHNPPPKPKLSEDDPSASYPTSAFSGKLVVGKTKIHTKGGKGSITIMRTKG